MVIEEFLEHPAVYATGKKLETEKLDASFASKVKLSGGHEEFFTLFMEEIGKVPITEPNVTQWISLADPRLHSLVKYVMSRATRTDFFPLSKKDDYHELYREAVLPMLAYPMYTKDQWVLNTDLKLFLGKNNTCIYNTKYNSIHWDSLTKTQQGDHARLTREFIEEFEDLSLSTKQAMMKESTQGKGLLTYTMGKVRNTMVDLDLEVWNTQPQMVRRMLLQTWIFGEQYHSLILDPLDWDRIPEAIPYPHPNE